MAVISNRPGTRRSRRIALSAAGALTLAGLGMVNAAPASAATLTATGGSLQWGLKESLLNYHIRHAGSTQTLVPAGGATASSTTRPVGALGTSPAENIPVYWEFPFVSGSYDSVTNSYTAQYGGSVAMQDSNAAVSTGPTGPSPFKNFVFANPAVVIDLDTGTKKLVVDLSPGDDGDPVTPVDPDVDNANFATFPNLTTEVVESGGTVTYTGLQAVLTQEGSDAFGGFYGAGDPVDPVTASLTGLAGGTEEPPPCDPVTEDCPGEEEPPPPGSQDQTITFTVPNVDCTGEVLWAIEDDSAVNLTEAAVDGTLLRSTGAIDPIEVTDSRTGNGADCYDLFEVSGQVSDFTGTAGTIPGEYLGWAPSVAGTGLVAGATVPSGYQSSGPGLTTSSPLVSTAPGATGSGQADAALTLEMPVNTPEGSYQATLTLTGMS
ncbi:MAG: HtaA domain-containing protein [Sporichthyaceae bacterium]